MTVSDLLEGARKWIVALSLVAIALVFGPIRAQLNAPQTWAGAAGGTSTAIVIPIHNVSSAADIVAVPLRFTASAVNNGPVTLQVTLDSGSSLGPYAVMKQTQTTGGLAALVGNELQTNQIVSVMLDGSTNCSGGPCFQCLTCAPTIPAGTVADFSGPNIPSGWVLANGTALSRTAQSVLWNAISFNTALAATTINGSAQITIASTVGYQLGWYVGGSNVQCNSQITSIPDGVHLVLNQNATNGGATTLSVGPYPQGDCAATFNIPDYIGRSGFGVDGSVRITSAGCATSSAATAATLGAGCGSQTYQITNGNLPASIPASIASTVVVGSSHNTGGQLGGTADVVTNATNISNGNTTVTVNGGGANTPHTILDPLILIYKIIKT